MRVYRIEKEKYLATTLSGTGASKTNGFRWNSENTYVVYTSDSRALSILEISVHLDLSQDLPTDRFYVEIDIPDNLDILELPSSELPDDWDSKPPIIETQYIGDDFIQNKNAAVLKVPSSIVPFEYNYLINPNHPDSAYIKVISSERLKLDSRLKQK